jgi:hypothetical protein
LFSKRFKKEFGWGELGCLPDRQTQQWNREKSWQCWFSWFLDTRAAFSLSPRSDRIGIQKIPPKAAFELFVTSSQCSNLPFACGRKRGLIFFKKLQKTPAIKDNLDSSRLR